jgi:hypothetical protein
LLIISAKDQNFCGTGKNSGFAKIPIAKPGQKEYPKRRCNIKRRENIFKER